ncbi:MULTISPECIES: ADP-ribosylglycohydrolase family protein [unclassified Kitasatospora]|uniref:ADP-ribosylglycohydrolase family protein n=1 Tax=unclassified Kitasatospora TaxID=2633591 RepID=UPI002474DCA0|nr:ADP-ribosylglycohydrolase family protein [Kitasatospora sp. MAP12-44]
MEGYRERVRGSLLGGAVGDALGWPVEFLQLQQIREQYGPAGVGGLEPPQHRSYRGRTDDRPGDVTDDTQMTLFTAEGLIRARLAGGPEGAGPALHAAYRRWFLTQQQDAPDERPLPAPYDGWLLRQPFLYARRAPGRACWTGLEEHPVYPQPAPFGQAGPVNGHSKGCGTVMRSAPFGLLRLGPDWAFELAGRCAQITHGHPTGYLSAGAFAALVELVVAGQPLPTAVDQVIAQVERWPQSAETVVALRRAVALAAGEEPSEDVVERVGLGWIAEECLAIAVYCALVAQRVGVRRALLLAVNHSGDSDSVGAVCGNLLGAAYGLSALPGEWVAAVEGRDVLLRVADDLVDLFAASGSALEGRYPAG